MSRRSNERHGEVGDPANDALRVDGRQVRALVVAEGGNLGFSQRGRIEYAAGGGRINADFIDNSAGVNTSDVEVNLKILLDAADGVAPLPRARRNRLLAAASDEIAALVLRNNYLQSQAISLMQRRAAADLGEHQRLLRWLERHGGLDRTVECLPGDEELAERRRQGRGLTRPELALLLAYGKIALNEALTEAGGAEDPYLARELQRYFPQALRRRYAARIEHPRLRARIITTAITNSCVNRVGPALLMGARLGSLDFAKGGGDARALHVRQVRGVECEPVLLRGERQIAGLGLVDAHVVVGVALVARGARGTGSQLDLIRCWIDVVEEIEQRLMRQGVLAVGHQSLGVTYRDRNVAREELLRQTESREPRLHVAGLRLRLPESGVQQMQLAMLDRKRVV